MIEFTASRDESGHLTTLEAKGHAEYAKHGEDIVCAAVTAICATTITALTDLLDLEPEYILEEGHILIALERSSYMGADAQLLMEAALLGVKQLCLEKDYARCLTVIDE